MKIIGYFNERSRRLNIFDIKLLQVSAMAVALIVVKLVPGIMDIGITWFVAILIVCSLRPLYVFFIRA